MHFGPFGRPLGVPDNVIDKVDVISTLGGRALISFTPQDDVGLFTQFGIYVNYKLLQTVIVDPSETFTTSVTLPNDAHIAILSQKIGMDLFRIASGLDRRRATFPSIRFNWPDATFTLDGDDPTANNPTNPNFSLFDFIDLKGSLVHPNIFSVQYEVTGTSPNFTVNILEGANILATGTGENTVTLTGTNWAGTLDNVVEIGTGEIQFYFFEDVTVKRQQDAGSIDPILDFPFQTPDNNLFFDEALLVAASNYTYFLEWFNDDDGTTAYNINVGTTLIEGAPLPPTNLRRTSGDQTTDLIIDWDASPTAGVSYNVYLKADGDKNMLTVSFGTTSGTSFTFPSSTFTVSTIFFVLVRAELSGIEEENVEYLRLAFDALGKFVSNKPRVCTLNQLSLVGDSTLTGYTIDALYDPANEIDVATTVNLYVRRSDGSYDFSTPTAIAALGPGTIPSIRKANISWDLSTQTPPLSDIWYCVAKTVTALLVESDASNEVQFSNFRGDNATTIDTLLVNTRGDFI